MCSAHLRLRAAVVFLYSGARRWNFAKTGQKDEKEKRGGSSDLQHRAILAVPRPTVNCVATWPVDPIEPKKYGNP
ncbi:hypothetical protein PMIN02_007397 [Paraphaeosphaeria minitans]